jgi:hypothetical protein
MGYKKQRWWMVAWRAPFVATSIVITYIAAILCWILTLAYNPRRASEIFNRVRDP